MRLARAVGVILLVLVATACGGGGRTLQLDSGPVSEGALRIQVRQSAFLEPPLFDVLCSALDDLSTTQVLDIFKQQNVFASRTPVAQADADDEQRALAVIREECEDIT